LSNLQAIILEYLRHLRPIQLTMPTRIFVTLNYLMAGFTLISCTMSIFNNDIYLDGEWANAQWLGQDIVTLVLALPLLLISLSRGVVDDNFKWKLVNSGILLYYVYTYSFFMFAAELTFLYLLHLPIYGLAVISFVMTCVDIFGKSRTLEFGKRSLKITIAVYLAFIALMVAVLWLGDIYAHLSEPGHRSETPDGKAPLIIYSLDLALILPLMILSAIQLLKGTTFGYKLTGIILIKTSTLGFALMAMGLSMYIQKLSPEYFLIVLWSILGILGTALSISYLKNLQSGSS